MICMLDIEKARNLRGIINENKYYYKYDLDMYAELCTVMDRFEDSVAFLSSYNLPMSNSEYNAFDFIAWVNYADLIINCLMSINTIYVVPTGNSFFHDNNVKLCGYAKGRQRKHLTAYYNVKVGDDDSYFKYLRSIVLAHSLKSDYKEFQKYHSGSQYSYTPLVRWNSTRDEVHITYYAPDSITNKLNTNSIELKIEDLFKYIQDRYSYIDKMFDYIKNKKNSHKEEIKNLFEKALSNISGSALEKTSIVKEAYSDLGDLDVKNEADIILYYLIEMEKILAFKFSLGNEEIINLFNEISECVIDNLISCLKNQDYSKLMLLDIFGYSTYDESKIFSSVYDANKISEEYENLLCFDEHCFREHYSKIENDLSKYCNLSKCSDKMELVFLTKMLITLDNVRLSTDKRWGVIIKNINSFYENR